MCSIGAQFSKGATFPPAPPLRPIRSFAKSASNNLGCASLALMIVLLTTFSSLTQETGSRTPRVHSPGTRAVKRTGTRDVKPAAARRPLTAEFQRDPLQLVKEFSLDEKTRHLPFDLPLAVSETFGEGAWEKFSQRQKAALRTAFHETIAGIWETWDAAEPEPVRILQNEIKASWASVIVLRGEELVRFKLASRNGAWYITEHELLDDASAGFSAGFRSALHSSANPSDFYKLPSDKAIRQINALIASQGETPDLLLLKYRLLEAGRLEEMTLHPDQQQKPDQSKLLDEILYRLTTRWPDFAPGRLARARALLYGDLDNETTISPLSQDPEEAIAELKHYVNLVPYDPRPHRDLAYAFEQIEKFDEAEAEFHRAIELDPSYLDHHHALISFQLLGDEVEKAKESFAQMLRAASNPDDAFATLWIEYSEEKPTGEEGKAIETILLAFPKELEGSYPGLSLLALAQFAQNKNTEAVKSLKQAIAIEASANDYAFLSTLYRQQRRFTEAADAAEQAIRFDDKFADGWFERACSLAQLGRKREALTALKQMLRIDAQSNFSPDEPDLQPLAAMPEFQAIVQKMKELHGSEEKETKLKVPPSRR